MMTTAGHRKRKLLTRLGKGAGAGVAPGVALGYLASKRGSGLKGALAGAGIGAGFGAATAGLKHAASTEGDWKKYHGRKRRGVKGESIDETMSAASVAKAMRAKNVIGPSMKKFKDRSAWTEILKKGKNRLRAATTALEASLDVTCSSCGSTPTEINEHEFNGIFCARHGERLDKYSRACYECNASEEDDTVVVCPECTSEDHYGVCWVLGLWDSILR